MTELLLLPFREVIINRDATERTSLDHAHAQPTHQLMATGQQNHIIRVGKTNNTLVILLAIRVRAVNTLPLIPQRNSLPAAQKPRPRRYSASGSASARGSAGSAPPGSTQTAGFRTVSAPLRPRAGSPPAASETAALSPRRSPSPPSAARAATRPTLGWAMPGRLGPARAPRARPRGPTSR